MRVRELRSLFVSTPGGPFNMALGKSSDTTMSDHLNRLASSFSRKFGERPSSTSYGVFGSESILDETVEQIFVETFRLPYENDEEWAYEEREARGFLKIVPPIMPVANDLSAGTVPRSASTVTAPRRTRDEVREYLRV